MSEVHNDQPVTMSCVLVSALGGFFTTLALVLMKIANVRKQKDKRLAKRPVCCQLIWFGGFCCMFVGAINNMIALYIGN